MADQKKSTVPVLAPDGEVYLIPPDQVGEAALHGGKLVMRMQAPSGDQYWIPLDELEEGLSYGGQLMQTDGKPYPKGIAPEIVGHNAAGHPVWGSKPVEKPGFLESAGNAVEGAAEGLVQFLDPRPTEDERARGLTTPYDTLMRYPERLVEPNVEMAEQVDKDLAEGRPGQAAAHAAGAVVPMAGPMAAQTMEQAGGQAGEGNIAGAAGTVAGNVLAAAATEAAPKLVGGMARAGKGRFTDLIASRKRLDTPIAPGEQTPYQRYKAAQRMGVNLDKAQATNASIPKAIKAPTEHDLGGGGIYDANTQTNAEDLHAEVSRMLAEAHPNPLSRREFGNRVQKALKAHKSALADEPGQRASAQALLDSITPQDMSRGEFGDAVKDALTEHRGKLEDHVAQLYDDLDQRLGDKRPDIGAIQAKAKGILQKNQRFYDDHPELLNSGGKRAWAVVKDLARGGGGEEGTLDQVVRTTEGDTPRYSWADLQRARSHMLDLTRGSEFIGDLPSGWVKQLTGAIDDTMTSAEKTPGMTARDVKQFREANDTYKALKTTYDAPQSPFYWMSRPEFDGLKTADKLSSFGPEQAAQLEQMMTESGHPELFPQLQRQTVSRIYDPHGNGEVDLDGLASRWEKTGKPQVAGILGPNHIEALNDLAARTAEQTPYDAPGSQLKQIIGANDGSTASEAMFDNSTGKLKLTPEEVAQVRKADPTLIPQLQRQAMDRVLDPPGNGTPDLKNFPSRWKRAPNDPVAGLLTPEQIKDLDDLSSVSKIVNYDPNPSGSAKVGQKVAEAGAIGAGVARGVDLAVNGQPLRGALAATAGPGIIATSRGIAKWMVDPASTAKIMEHEAPTPLREALKTPIPGAGTAAMSMLAAEQTGQTDARDGIRAALDRKRAATTPAPASSTPASREGVSTPPNEGQVGSVAAAEPNEVHDESAAQTELQRLNAGAEAAKDLSKIAPVTQPPPPGLGNADVYTGSGIDKEVPALGPQSSMEPPEGATHEVLHPETLDVMGHVVGGEYVPLSA